MQTQCNESPIEFHGLGERVLTADLEGGKIILAGRRTATCVAASDKLLFRGLNVPIDLGQSPLAMLTIFPVLAADLGELSSASCKTRSAACRTRSGASAACTCR